MSEISSGLVAVACQVRNGWSSCDLYRTLKSATEDRDMLQKRADFAGNLMAYRVEPLVRLSDAEAIIAQQSERIKELESEVDEEAHIRDRMAKLLAETAVALKGQRRHCIVTDGKTCRMSQPSNPPRSSWRDKHLHLSPRSQERMKAYGWRLKPSPQSTR
jgi:hypothetical protein